LDSHQPAEFSALAGTTATCEDVGNWLLAGWLMLVAVMVRTMQILLPCTWLSAVVTSRNRLARASANTIASVLCMTSSVYKTAKCLVSALILE
jgi:hypothetical protein